MTSTPQSEFWRGEFGNAYVDRNVASPEQMQARLALWSEILSHTISAPPTRILEIGANLGINLRAFRQLSSARRLALEPNAEQYLRSRSRLGMLYEREWLDNTRVFRKTLAELVREYVDLLHAESRGYTLGAWATVPLRLAAL